MSAETDKARAAAAQSENLRQQAEKEKQELRARLLQQLNSILATRDSARGLVANMSDVLFRSGSFELLPAARERLAKVSGIVLAYPSLHVAIEGHTDSVGSDQYNQDLSEHRAESVRDYFVQQGIQSSAIEARGFGKTDPIASNDTAEGRQQNRRVELVLSGDAIGNTIDEPAQGPATSTALARTSKLEIKQFDVAHSDVALFWRETGTFRKGAHLSPIFWEQWKFYFSLCPLCPLW